MPPIFGKKKKADAQGISNVLSGASSSYVTKSRKASNPQTSSIIKKGSTVTSSPSGKALSGFAKVPASASIKIGTPSLRVTNKYEHADLTTGQVVKRTTTPEHAKIHNEDPGKVAARMQAQSEGKTSYPHPKTGKAELSGISNSTIHKSPGKVSISTESKSVPTYSSYNKLNVKTPASGGHNAPRYHSAGGTTKGDHPANKSGIGTKKSFIITKKKTKF